MPLTRSELSEEEWLLLPRELKAKVWRPEYDAHVAGMTVPPELTAWAQAMTIVHGSPDVAVLWHPPMPWLHALLVVRYGEEPAHWPTAFTAEDALRAQKWLTGESVPQYVQFAERQAAEARAKAALEALAAVQQAANDAADAAYHGTLNAGAAAPGGES